MCLIQNILEGKTVPTVGVDAIVWVEGDNLEIFVDSLIGTEQEPDEIVSFFWNYDEKKR